MVQSALQRIVNRRAILPNTHPSARLRTLRNTKTYRQFFPVSARFLDRISTQFEDRAFFRNRYLQILVQAVTLTLVNCGVILAYSDDCYAGLLRANFAGVQRLG